MLFLTWTLNKYPILLKLIKTQLSLLKYLHPNINYYALLVDFNSRITTLKIVGELFSTLTICTKNFLHMQISGQLVS